MKTPPSEHPLPGSFNPIPTPAPPPDLIEEAATLLEARLGERYWARVMHRKAYGDLVPFPSK